MYTIGQPSQTALAKVRCQRWVKQLGLRPPDVEHPGYWHTHDDFAELSSAVASAKCPQEVCLRALVSYRRDDFEASGMFKPVFAHQELKSEKQRKEVWAETMRKKREARTQWVRDIVEQFEKHGVEIPPYNIEVHRIRNTAYITLTPEKLGKIIDLHERGECDLFSHIKIDRIAEF